MAQGPFSTGIYQGLGDEMPPEAAPPAPPAPPPEGMDPMVMALLMQRQRQQPSGGGGPGLGALGAIGGGGAGAGAGAAVGGGEAAAPAAAGGAGMGGAAVTLPIAASLGGMWKAGDQNTWNGGPLDKPILKNNPYSLIVRGMGQTIRNPKTAVEGGIDSVSNIFKGIF